MRSIVGVPDEGTVLEKPLKDTVKFTKPHLKRAFPWREHATARIDIQRVILYIGGSL